MTNNIETQLLSGNSIRQYINAKQAFTALRDAEMDAKQFRGGMFWREVKGHVYLIRTTTKSSQKSLGAKNPQTEAIFNKFTQGKQVAEERRASLVKALAMHRRLNKALFVGRVDDQIIDILNGLREVGLEHNFIVIGTNALYAYEASAGVRIEQEHLATNDLDLLWDNRRKLTIAVPESFAGGMIGFLQKIDKTFKLRSDQLYTAVNANGYEVDFLRRMDHGHQTGLAKVSQVDGDFWAVKARNIDWLLSAPKFKEVVVGTNGSMAEITTVDPRAFALFKFWMSKQKDRDALKKIRDANQARVVVQLIKEYLPQLSFEDVHYMPAAMRKWI